MTTPTPTPATDRSGDAGLRPLDWKGYEGQPGPVNRLRLACAAASGRRESLDHVLVVGPSGLGKTTLAGIVARSMGVNLVTAMAPNVEKILDAAKLLAKLRDGDALFVDEIHRLPMVVEEFLYSAMEDFFIDADLGKGMVRYKLPRFTLIGATTRLGMLSPPLRNRFPIVERLEYYEPAKLAAIVRRSAGILGVTLTEDAALEIGRRARGTPRVANNLLRRVRDFAQIVAKTTAVDAKIAAAALDAMELDADGLGSLDRKILKTLATYDRPVSLKAVAAAVGEDVGTIEEAHEPWLVLNGFVMRSQRGRVVTDKGKQKIK